MCDQHDYLRYLGFPGQELHAGRRAVVLDRLSYSLVVRYNIGSVVANTVGSWGVLVTPRSEEDSVHFIVTL